VAQQYPDDRFIHVPGNWLRRSGSLRRLRSARG
jgi:hypothetical protein